MISVCRKKENRWVWKSVVDLKEPKPDIRTAFRVVIDNNWQGIAYLMLEVAGLDFVEALQVKLTCRFTWGLPIFSNSNKNFIYPFKFH